LATNSYLREEGPVIAWMDVFDATLEEGS